MDIPEGSRFVSPENDNIIYEFIGKDDKNENIIAYTKNEKADCQAFEKGVVNFLNYYDLNSKVKLYTDLKQFTKKAVQLAGQNAEITDSQKEHILYIYEKISIMSV